MVIIGKDNFYILCSDLKSITLTCYSSNERIKKIVYCLFETFPPYLAVGWATFPRAELRRLTRLTSFPTRFGKFNTWIASRNKIIYILTNFGPNDAIRKPIYGYQRDLLINAIKVIFLH